MQREEIAFVGTSDLSGHFRGKSFPKADLPARLQHGVGLAPSNLFLSAFGPIQFTPFGTLGEVLLIPDRSTRVDVPFAGGSAEHFYIGDIKTLDDAPWDFCPRHVLRRALDRLQSEQGLQLFAAFEQEFTYSGVPEQHHWQPYALDSFRRQESYGETLLAALREARVIPDSFLAEYGPQQFEVTCAPAIGLRAADNAVITREIAQAVAFRCGQRVSFTPIPTPGGVSNGTHIHWSFLDGDERPVLYDEARAGQLSLLGSSFLAGIQYHLPALSALTAPSVPSYYRLRPNHWAPVRADVGALDRGASLRICPVSSSDPARARKFNLEYRVADATASPYLALAMLVQAGLEGVREKRQIELDNPRPLPTSLEAALALLEQTPAAAGWLGNDLLSAYLSFKRAEIRGLENLDEDEICRRYAAAY
jgi:glutamine synthetase